ncbi:MAG: hypothetical protein JEZ08_03710 [Clostridiales bacterium]|nr:hypothetical protein [Clostridiales bacterium]
MTLETIEQHKKYCIKKIITYTILMFIYAFVALILNDSIMAYVYAFMILIGVVSYKSMLKYEKEKKPISHYNWKSEPIIARTKNYNREGLQPYLVFILPVMVFFFLLFSELLEEVTTAQIFLHIVVFIGIGIIIVHYIKKYHQYHFVAFKEGILYHYRQIEYSEIKKYQFIKLKKGGFLLELNTGKSFITVRMSDIDANLIKIYF